MKKYFISLAVIVLIGHGAGAIAATDQPDTDPSQLSYVFRLYYDNGKLVADRDFEFNYDIITETFVPETINTSFPYRGEIINLNNQVAAAFQFDPKHSDIKFVKVKISVKAPYIPDGQKAVFYDSQGNTLLTIFVSDSSFCNDDGTCDPNTGENTKTCPNDCKASTPAATTASVPAGATMGGVITGIVYLLIGAGLAGGFWYYMKKKKEPPTPNPQNPV